MPMPAGIHGVVWGIALPYASRGPGNYVTPAYSARYPRWAIADLEMLIHVAAITGSPSLSWSIQSTSDGTAWTNIPGTTGTLSAAGSAAVNAGGISVGQSVRFASRVTGGASDEMVYRVLAVLFTLDLP